jgi:hypothetical protein
MLADAKDGEDGYENGAHALSPKKDERFKN